MGAVYGFFSILIKLFTDLKPTYIAVAFDREAPTFRKKLLAGYQAQRPKMDDDLSVQIDKVHDMLGECGIPVFEKNGYEADDVIGTLSRKCQMPNAKCQIDDVVIATGDRDILQLVEDDRVKVYMPTKGLSEGKLYGEKDVVERMGVLPKKIADLKALTGDSSDNYPGVAGIGPKTAVNLLARFRDLDGIYRDIEVKGKRKKEKVENILSERVIEKLREGRKSAFLCKDLATIRTDAALGKIDLLAFDTLYTLRIRAALERFPSLVARLAGKEEEKVKKDKEEKKVKEKDPSEQLPLV